MTRANYGLYTGKTSLEYHRDYRKRKPEQCLLSSARSRAKRKGVPFNLTLEDIDIPVLCPVLGEPLVRSLGSHGGGPFSPSIDRIVPSLGYVKGNVRVISLLANNMKSSATPEQMIKFARWVLENHT